MDADGGHGNGCGGTPPRTIDLYSGWTEYRVGVARKDITVTMGVGEMDVAKRVGMAGFAYEGQRAHSVDPDTTGGVAKRNGHFARAFIMTRNSLNSNEAAVIVVCDLWIISQAVKREVAARLATQSWAQRYTADRIMLCATHTHAGVGGYSEYYLYNMTIGGFVPEVFDQIVEGIVDSILEAHRSLAPGQVLVNEGPLGGCGMIRSMDPFRANAESNLQEFAGQDPVDPKPMMTLLRFQRLDGAHQGWTDIGSINWYALHPTSLGVYNTAVSGDNKGWAALRLEEKMLARPGHGADYVAGFANGAAGDVSGNVGPGQGIPMGGPKKPAELAKDRQRMKDLGELQCDHALQLILGAVEEMTGPLDVRYDHVDMSMVTIQGTNDRTWPATLGVSFGAGSSEDGEPLISEGSDMKSAIPEGVDQTMYAAEAVVAIATAVTLVLEVAALISLPVSILGLSARLARLFAEGYGAYKSIWIQANIAYIGLSFKDMPARDPQDPLDKLYDWKIEAPVLLPWAMTQGQNSKPIMLPVGVTWVEPRVGPKRRTEVPMVPHVAPLQLLRLGQLALIGVPAEFTQIAARRLTDGMQAALAPLGINRLAVAGYTNAYSGYVTTPQEYQVQHYEGASTLYGPHTLAAYRQEFGRLAASLAAGTALPASAPAIVPVISFR